MSADKFKQLSSAFLKISQGFSDVANIMSNNLEATELTMVDGYSTVNLSSGISSLTTEPSSSSQHANSSDSPAPPAAKKVKKEKDPNAPKRPLNAYFLFQKEFLHRAKIDTPNASNLMKLTYEAWEGLKLDEKAKYENDSKAQFEEYSKQMKEYNSKQKDPAVIAKEEKVESVKTLPVSTLPDNSALPDNSTTLSLAMPVAQSCSSDTDATTPDISTPKKKKKKNKNREGESSASKSFE